MLKRPKNIFIMAFFAMSILTLKSSISFAYIIDGSVSDWGVLLNSDSQTQGYLNTHTPTGGNDIDYITEDNADKNSGSVLVGPGWTTGNRYDAEALYFDNDHFNTYLAIITGLSSSEVDYPAGDIFLDTGKYQDPSSSFYNPNRYEYAINIQDSKLYRVDSWQNIQFPDYSASNPWRIGNNKTLITDDIDFIYGTQVNTHYVLEASIPLQYLGLTNVEGQEDIWLHWTMKCGNDNLNLHGDVNVAPEPGTMSLFLTGLGVAFARLRRKFC